MYHLTRFVAFEASHRYWNPMFSTEENKRIFGKCVSTYGHGHNYILRVTLQGNVAPETGMVVNIQTIDRILKDIISEFDHKFINLDHPAFSHRIPTTENIVAYMRSRIIAALPPVGEPYCLYRVTLYEDPTLWSDSVSTQRETMAYLTKKFIFSAAHRLHSATLSAEANRQIFGKCNNPHGHGHNYELEVTVNGEIDSRTGMIIDLLYLMDSVQSQVLDRFDHKHLNHDTVEFRSLNPTGENITKVIWDILHPTFGDKLVKIGLWETPKNYFEYYGM